MSYPGTEHQGLQLAKQRWAQWNSFDLEDSKWMELFNLYGCGTVLESIKVMRRFGDPNPERRYQLFLNRIEKLFASSHR